MPICYLVWHYAMKGNKSITFNASMEHVGQQDYIETLQCNQTIKKGFIKSIKYVILKHYNPFQCVSTSS